MKFKLLVFPLVFLGFGCNSISQGPTMHSYNITLPEIGSFEEKLFREGGFSGLTLDKSDPNILYAINDRGPNSYLDGKIVVLFPDYSQKIFKLQWDKNDGIQFIELLPIKFNDTTFTNGYSPPMDDEFSNETIIGGSDRIILDKSQAGMDFEGITIDPYGFFWACEEYRPSIIKINPISLVIEQIISPYSHPALEVLKNRDPNRGFEGITATPDGHIIAVMQSPLEIEEEKNAGLTRIMKYNPESGQINWFFYPMEKPIGDLRAADWKIGDITAINENEFLILEHAHRKNTTFKYVTKFSLNEPLIKKEILLDLMELGWDPSLEKVEGIQILNPYQIAIVNDNDYGVASEEPVPTKIFIIELPESMKLNHNP
jgi:hypothetical protein